MLRHLLISVKLNFRNPMALIYGYLFPLLFLFAFWAIYRHEQPPLMRHMGEILTITLLGGACFGLPTTLVSERERGVWRRYRLAPTPSWAFLVSLLTVRYLLLLTAGLIQLALACAIGASLPESSLSLLLAFTFAAFALMGVGLVIAMLSDSVPAVQALGQCVFLPMLIVGGVALPLSSLPGWAQHVSALFPGRYAVQSLQATFGGQPLDTVSFDLVALLLIGLAGLLAAVKMFRWEPSHSASAEGKPWILVVLGVWLSVGVAAELQDRIIVQPSEVRAEMADPVREPDHYLTEGSAPKSWREVTEADFAEIAFERLPPDDGIVAPIAALSDEPDPYTLARLDEIRTALLGWTPAQVEDPVQRARNLLFVAAVPDLLQMADIERFLPAVVLGRLRQSIPPADLPKILYWVALHPGQGDDTAITALPALGLPEINGPTRRDSRGRVMLYAFKLLERVTPLQARN
ncbi:ABC transporter permease [Steroidobacter agaridevorans]|uniref:ABC transporter permease n=1 Tax=Steroidobacter agaridevorans TaxID=2695856 RepID=UPI001AD9304E|nr:ABC transporter permease [Steroidobacter agaridevorans]